MQFPNLKFPPNSRLNETSFLFGVATASYQIEGATNEGGRLKCIWDTYAEEGHTANGDSGAVACDHYHRWSEDLDLIKSLNVDAYRLSLAWPRVMTEDGSPNHTGIDFYKKILDKMKAEGIKSYVTLFHWDLPQHLQDRGGWINRETAYRFQDYTNLMSRELGDRVDSWATFNEPHCSSYVGYKIGRHAPGYEDDMLACQAAHHHLLAHGLAVDILRDNAPTADIGIVLNVYPAYPETDSDKDKHAATLAETSINDWFMGPIFDGAYPDLLPEALHGAKPAAFPSDMSVIHKPLDYVGINYYTRWVVKAGADGLPEHVEQSNEATDMGWEIYPDGFRDILVKLSKKYDLPPIYITENGSASPDKIENGIINDDQRVRYLTSHLNALHEAIEEGVDVRGYFAWSLMDNFEWAEGYSKRFGLVHVDYDTQVRTKKNSALMLEKFLKKRKGAKE